MVSRRPPAAVRALLARVIDYAGLFPPASLGMEQALANFADYRRRPEAWMLGTLICPASRLSELAHLSGQVDSGFQVAAVVQGGDTIADFAQRLEAGLRQAAEGTLPDVVAAFEIRWPAELAVRADGAKATDLVWLAVGQLQAAGVQPQALFFELPTTRPGGRSVEWLSAMETAIDALARYHAGAGAARLPAGLKLRTGGADASVAPSPAQLAHTVCACRDAGVFWKATAGLHHPWRHVDRQLGIEAHGDKPAGTDS